MPWTTSLPIPIAILPTPLPPPPSQTPNPRPRDRGAREQNALIVRQAERCRFSGSIRCLFLSYAFEDALVFAEGLRDVVGVALGNGERVCAAGRTDSLTGDLSHENGRSLSSCGVGRGVQKGERARGHFDRAKGVLSDLLLRSHRAGAGPAGRSARFDLLSRSPPLPGSRL